MSKPAHTVSCESKGVNWGNRDLRDDNNRVILVSTHTTDRLPTGIESEVRETPGGPAHYIGQALRRLHVPYRLVTGDHAIVEVVRGVDGEQYVIPSIPPITMPDALHADIVIFSPIMREIAPNNLPAVSGRLVVDLQGFVRTPGARTDEIREKVDLLSLFRRTQYVKATPSELERLDGPSRAALDEVTLIVTRGPEGCTLYERGREHAISAHPVRSAHSIGAGDTFLAAFVRGLLNGETPITSATSAARFTETFLRAAYPIAEVP